MVLILWLSRNPGTVVLIFQASAFVAWARSFRLRRLAMAGCGDFGFYVLAGLGQGFGEALPSLRRTMLQTVGRIVRSLPIPQAAVWYTGLWSTIL